MAKLDKYDRDIIEHALNKLEIHLPNSVLSFLVEAGRQALTGNGRGE